MLQEVPAMAPSAVYPLTAKELYRVRQRKYAPSFDFGAEGAVDEYLRVRFEVLFERMNGEYAEIELTERAEREAARSEYKDETFWLKWSHRQRQTEERRAFEQEMYESAKRVEALEAMERQDVYEGSVRDYKEQLEKGACAIVTDADPNRPPTTAERRATEQRHREEAALYERRLDAINALEGLQREETHARAALTDMALSMPSAERDLRIGSIEQQLARTEAKETTTRAALCKDETHERTAGLLGTLHRVSMLWSGESFFRAKIVDYLEPRRRDALQQQFRRELDFVVWHQRLKAAAWDPNPTSSTPTRWQGEAISPPGGNNNNPWSRTPV